MARERMMAMALVLRPVRAMTSASSSPREVKMARERTMGISLLHPARATIIRIHRMSVLHNCPSCSEARRASRASMSCLASRLVLHLAVQIG